MSRPNRPKAAGAAVAAPLLVPASPVVTYKALKGIRLGADAYYAAGDLLPLPRNERMAAEYIRLIRQKALQSLLDGRPYITAIFNHGARTRPTVTRTPI